MPRHTRLRLRKNLRQLCDGQFIMFQQHTQICLLPLCSLVLPNTAHSTDIAHGITPNKHGAKYMLILKHHFNRPDKAGVIRLSKELVEEAVAKKKA